jgi:hypothetical protein
MPGVGHGLCPAAWLGPSLTRSWPPCVMAHGVGASSVERPAGSLWPEATPLQP